MWNISGAGQREAVKRSASYKRGWMKNPFPWKEHDLTLEAIELFGGRRLDETSIRLRKANGEFEPHHRNEIEHQCHEWQGAQDNPGPCNSPPAVFTPANAP